MNNYADIAVTAFITIFMCFQINFYFDSVLDKAVRRPVRWPYFLAYAILNFAYLYVRLPSVASSVLSIAMIFVFSLSYTVDIRKQIAFSVVYLVLLTTISGLAVYLLQVSNWIDFTGIEDELNRTSQSILFKIVILTDMIMIAVIQVIRLTLKHRRFTLHYRYYLLFLTVPVFSIYQINVLSSDNGRTLIYFISALGLLYINIVVIYMFDSIVDKFQLRHENAELQRQMDYQDANFEKTVHAFKSIKRIIHDTNKQFLFIDECLQKKELEAAHEHIQVTLDKIEDAYERVNTGNLMIDALVSNTLSIAKANGIKVDTKISLYSQDIGVERYDFCVVLGNMLDNALEASKKIKLAEDRYILIDIHSVKNAISIHVFNHTDKEVSNLRTHKANQEYHGIGMTNIARICEKYGGNMTIEAEKKTFRNMVVLPF